MNLTIALTTIIGPIVSGAVAALFVHVLNGRRDRESDKREHVIKCLTVTYRELTLLAAPRSSATILTDRLSKLLEDLILFGDTEVVCRARRIRDDLEDGSNSLNFGRLLVCLRANIRNELGLPVALDDSSPVLQVSFKQDSTR